MTTASIKFTVAHVPCSPLKSIDREIFPVRICARLRWRAHGETTKRTTPPATQSAAVSSPFGSVIASILPDWRRLRTAFERTRTPSARAVRIFPSEGQRWESLRFIGALGKALRSLCSSVLFSLVHLRQKPTSGVSNRFQFSPVLSFAPTNHAHKKAWSREHGAQRNSASGA